MSEPPERLQQPRAAKTEAHNAMARPQVVPGASGYFIVAKRHNILIKQRHTPRNRWHTLEYRSSAPLLTMTDSRDYVDKVLEVLKTVAGISCDEILGMTFIMDDADSHYARAWIKKRVVTDEGIPICRMINWRNALAQDAMFLAIYGVEVNEKCALVAFYGPVQYVFWMQYTKFKWAIRQVVPYSMNVVKEEVELLVQRLQQWNVTSVVVYSDGDPHGHPMETIRKLKTFLEETGKFQRVISCRNRYTPGTESDGLIGGFHHALLARDTAEAKVTQTIPTMVTSHVQDQCYWNLRVNIDNQVYVYPRMYHRMYPYRFTKTITEEDVKYARRLWVEYFDVLGDKTWKPYAIYPFKFKAAPQLTFTMDVDKDGIVTIYPEIDSHDVKQCKAGLYTTAAFPDHIAPKPSSRPESSGDGEVRYMLNRTPSVLRSQQANIGNGTDASSDEDTLYKLNPSPPAPETGNDNESVLSSDSDTRYMLNPAPPKPQNEPVADKDEDVWADDGVRYVLNPAPPTVNNHIPPKEVNSSIEEAKNKLNPPPPAQPQKVQPPPPVAKNASDDDGCNLLKPIPLAPPIRRGAKPYDDIEVVPVKGSEGFDHQGVRQPSWIPVNKNLYLQQQIVTINKAAALAHNARLRARRQLAAPVANPAVAPVIPKVVNKEIKQEAPEEVEKANPAKPAEKPKSTELEVPSKTPQASKQQIPLQQPKPTKTATSAPESSAVPAPKTTLPKPVTAPTTTIPAIPRPQPVVPALGPSSRDANSARRDAAVAHHRGEASETQTRQHKQHPKPSMKPETDKSATSKHSSQKPETPKKMDPQKTATPKQPPQKPEQLKQSSKKSDTPKQLPKKPETPKNAEPNKVPTSKPSSHKSGSTKPEPPKQALQKVASKPETPKKAELKKPETLKSSKKAVSTEMHKQPTQKKLECRKRPATESETSKQPEPKKAKPSTPQQSPKKPTSEKPLTSKPSPQSLDPKKDKPPTLSPNKVKPKKFEIPKQSPKKPEIKKPHTSKPSPLKTHPKKPEPPAPVKLQKQPKPEMSTPKKRPSVGQQPEEPKKHPVFVRISPRKPQTPIKQPQMPPTPRPVEPSPKKPVEEPIDEEPPAKRPIRHPKQSKPAQKAESPKPVEAAKPSEPVEPSKIPITVQSRPESPKRTVEILTSSKPVETAKSAQPAVTAKQSKTAKVELESPKTVAKAPKTEIQSPKSAESESVNANTTSSDEPPAKRLRQRNPAPPKPAPKPAPAKKAAPKPKPQSVQKGRVVKKEAPPTRATRGNTRKEPKGETISPPVLRTRKR